MKVLLWSRVYFFHPKRVPSSQILERHLPIRTVLVFVCRCANDRSQCAPISFSLYSILATAH